MFIEVEPLEVSRLREAVDADGQVVVERVVVWIQKVLRINPEVIEGVHKDLGVLAVELKLEVGQSAIKVGREVGDGQPEGGVRGVDRVRGRDRDPELLAVVPMCRVMVNVFPVGLACQLVPVCVIADPKIFVACPELVEDRQVVLFEVEEADVRGQK